MTEEYTPNDAEARNGYINGLRALRPELTSADKARRGAGFDRWLAAHDADLVAAARAKQHATTREAIAKALAGQDVSYPTRPGGWSSSAEVTRESALTLADALLAPDGPLLDAAEVERRGAEKAWDVLLATGKIATANPYREARP